MYAHLFTKLHFKFFNDLVKSDRSRREIKKKKQLPCAKLQMNEKKIINLKIS